MLLLSDPILKGFFQTTQQKELLDFIANLLVPKHILSQYKYFANLEQLSKMFFVPDILIKYQE